MDNSNEVDHPYEGQKFTSFEALKKYLEDYGQRNYVKFWIRSSHTRNSLKSKLSKTMNPDFKYVCVKFACIFGGEKIRCRGSGIRKSSTYRNLGCPCMINAVVGEDGNHVKLDTVILEHNHVLCKTLYDSLKKTKKKSQALTHSLEVIHNGESGTSQNLRVLDKINFPSSIIEDCQINKQEFINNNSNDNDDHDHDVNDNTVVLNNCESENLDASDAETGSKCLKNINDKHGNNVKIFLVNSKNKSDDNEESSYFNQMEDENDELPNLCTDICRLCLSSNDKLLPIFNPDLPLESTFLSFKIMGCASIEINSNDGLPNNICTICEATLDIAYNFRLRCEKSDSLLRKAHLRRDILNTTKNLQAETNSSKVPNDKVSNNEKTPTQNIIVSNQKFTENKESRALSLGITPEITENENEIVQASAEETLVIYQEVTEEERKENYNPQTYSLEVVPKRAEKEIRIVQVPAQKTLITYQEVTEEETEKENYTPETLCLEVTGKTPENVIEIVQATGQETFVSYQEITEEVEKEEDYNLKTSSRTYSTEGKVKRKEKQKDIVNTSTQESLVNYQENTEGSGEGNYNQETFNSEVTRKGMNKGFEVTAIETLTLEDRNQEPSFVELVVSCPVCGTNFETYETMLDHLENHPIDETILLACNICSLICPTVKELQDHMREHVKNSKGEEFSCRVCNLTYATSEELSNHEVTHLATATSAVPSAPTLSSTPTSDNHKVSDLGYLCNFCGKILRTKDRFQAHKNTHEGLKPHICVKCGKGFADRKNMYQHNDVVHLRKAKHECPVCHKKFYTRTKMYSHITMHYDFKPFTCDVCNKTFRLKMNMIKHKKTHSNDRPHQCDKCTAAFIDRNMLKRHSYVHGGVRPFLCPSCGHRFSVKSHLKKHLQKSKCKEAATIVEKETVQWKYIPPPESGLNENECVIVFKTKEENVLEEATEEITMDMLQDYNEVPNT